MKNMIICIAIMLISAFFLCFQSDINDVQRKSIVVGQLAEDGARAACLEIDEDIFSEGYISFDPDTGVQKAMTIVQSGMEAGTHYDVLVFLFDEAEYESVYTEYINGQLHLKDMPYEKGHYASEYIPDLPKNYDRKLEYPCVICVIDTGYVKFKLDFLSDIAILKKAGMHEYLKG